MLYHLYTFISSLISVLFFRSASLRYSLFMLNPPTFMLYTLKLFSLPIKFVSAIFKQLEYQKIRKFPLCNVSSILKYRAIFNPFTFPPVSDNGLHPVFTSSIFMKFTCRLYDLSPQSVSKGVLQNKQKLPRTCNDLSYRYIK